MEKKLERYLYIDTLRLLVIISVILLHFACTYSVFGDWYYREVTDLDIFSTIVFGYLMSYTQGYFMGFLFLLSGFFIPGSFDKKGPVKFLKDRFVRLVIPTLIYMLMLNPFIQFFLLGYGYNPQRPVSTFLNYYWTYLCSFKFLGESGPLWFALALFIFSCIYTLIRLIKCAPSTNAHKITIKLSHVTLLIVFIAIGAFCIRLIQPIGTNFFNMQLGYFSQYIFLFIVGILAYRNDWFATTRNSWGSKLLVGTFLVGFIPWAAIMIFSGVLDGIYLFNGGMYWQSASFALWESSISILTAIGLITVFRDKYNTQNKFVKILSDNSFAVYVFHAPIIIYLSLLLKDLSLPPLIKFVLLSLIGVPVCFIITQYVIKRIPLLNKVL